MPFFVCKPILLILLYVVNEYSNFYSVKKLPDEDNFITGSNKGSPNTRISNIDDLSYFISNCVISEDFRNSKIEELRIMED